MLSCSRFGVVLFHPLLSVTVQLSACLCMCVCVRTARHHHVRHAVTVSSSCQCALSPPFVSFFSSALCVTAEPAKRVEEEEGGVELSMVSSKLPRVYCIGGARSYVDAWERLCVCVKQPLL